MAITESEILTLEEVAAYLKAGKRTIYRLAAARKIPAFKVGGTWRFSRAEIDAGVPALDAFLKAGLIDSKGEGRRHIKAGALKVNDAPLTDERALGPEDLLDGAIKLSVGKKKHALVRLI